jgi:hypothetical protein
VSAATTAAAAEPAAVVKANKFSGFLRRPRPIGGSGTAAAGPTVLPSTAEIPAAGTTEETSAGTEVDSGRFVEFVPTLPPPATTTPPPPPATTRFQLEDFFGTPESVAASELSAARSDAATAAAFSPSARLVDAQRPPLLGSEDISENLILEEVRSRTAAITGETANRPGHENLCVHCKKRLAMIFPSPARDVTSQTLPWPGISRLFSARESWVSDIPAGDGKIANFFLQCTSMVFIIIYSQYTKAKRAPMSPQL